MAADLKDPKTQALLNWFMVQHAPLIQKHINILKSKGMVPSNIDEGDLHLAGFHGLMDAVHKYNPEIASRTSVKEGENAFSKYAEKRLMGKMLDHIASQDEIPRQARIRAKNLQANNPSQVVTTPVSPNVEAVASETQPVKLKP